MRRGVERRYAPPASPLRRNGFSRRIVIAPRKRVRARICQCRIVSRHLSLVPVSLAPRRGFLVTTAHKTQWEELLTAQAAGPELLCALQLAWRASTRGGRVWAAPQSLTASQTAALTGDWSPTRGSVRSTISVQVQGDLGSDPAHTLNALVRRLRAETLQPRAVAPMGSVPLPLQIAPVAGPHADPREQSGRCPQRPLLREGRGHAARDGGNAPRLPRR